MAYYYKILVSYDGYNYSGFQKQLKQNSIQAELEKALTRMNANQKVDIIASGRTDAKVHAIAQVCTFSSIKDFSKKYFLNTVNNLLPDDIHVFDMQPITEDFHPRFNAKAKKYEYLINMGTYNVFKARYQWQLSKELDIQAMRQASSYLIGEHDFRTFSSAKASQNSIKTIFDISFILESEILKIEFYGSGFLRYMVRKLTMVLVDVGLHKIEPEKVKELLDKTNIAAYSKVAPGTGLYLKEVIY